MKILILGGYGVTGPYIARQILKFTTSEIIIAGRDFDKANILANVLNTEFGSARAAAVRIDANDAESLETGFSRADFIIVASSTLRYTENVLKAGIDAGVDYLDIQYSRKKTESLYTFAEEIKRKRLHYFTECGSFPGIPAVLFRHLGKKYDEMKAVSVAALLKEKGGQKMRDSLVEMIKELSNYSALKFKHGHWKKAIFWGIFDSRRIDFGNPFGKKICLPVVMEEVIKSSELFPELDKAGMYAAGYNKLVNLILMPIIMIITKLFPESGAFPMAKLLHWGTSRFDKPPWGIVIKAEAAGISDGGIQKNEIRISCDSGYHLTAASVAAVIRQYLKKVIDEPGIHISGLTVEPTVFLEDLRLQGVNVSYITKSGSEKTE